MKYSVEVRLGTLTTEVDADDDDHAIDVAFEEWHNSASDILAAGTFSARVVEDA